MELIYHLTDEARRRLFVETGRDPGQVQALEVDPPQLSADDRRLLAEINPALTDKVQLTLRRWADGAYDQSRRMALEAIESDPAHLLALYRDAREAAEAVYAEARAAALEQQLQRYQDWDVTYNVPVLNEGLYRDSPRLSELRAAYRNARDRYNARQREQVERARQDEAAREAEKAARIAERAQWAAAHGSPRLRKCVGSGYDCQRLYVLERAALEHAGYTVDFDDKADWKSRSAPSEEALDEAARVGGEVVWLTAYPLSDGTPEEYQDGWQEEREAVVIRGYLGKYDLVKVL